MNQTDKAQKIPIWLLALTMGAGTVGNYIVSPALSPITEYFGVDEASSQAILTGFFIPMALFPIIFGSFSDRYGRRYPLLFGLAVMTVGGLIAATAESFDILIIARFLQGLGAASVSVIIIPVINDSYSYLEAPKILAKVNVIRMIVPFFSFAFGGLIAEIFGWRGNMILIFLAGLVSLIFTHIFLKETNLRPLQKINLVSLARNYLCLLSNRTCVVLMLAVSFTIGLWLTMLGFVPFEYQRMGVDSAEVGLWFMAVPFGYALGNYFTQKFVHKFGIENLCQIGGWFSLPIIITFLIPSILDWVHPMLIGIPCLIFGFSSALLLSTANMGAIAAAGELGGSASGLINSTQTLFGVIGGSLVVGIGGFENFERGVFVLIGFALLAAICSSLAKPFRANLSSSSP